MAGWLTPGFPQLSIFSGSEQLNLDTELSSGAAPQSAMTTTQQLAVAFKWLNATADKTTVAGTRYFSSWVLGSAASLTGIEVLVGGTGGTDLWIAELFDDTGALVATSSTSGTTAGTANIWQRLAFTAAYEAAAGTYFLSIQSNGTTAKPAVYTSPGLPILTGSAAGTFAVAASITAPTTYTASTGPMAMPY